MKRLHLLVVTAAAAFVAFPGTALSDPPVDTVQGPQCGNIALDAAYRSIGGVPTVVGTFGTEGAAACSFVTYTVYVYSPNGQTLLASEELTASEFGDFEIPLVGGGNQVCVYAESTIGPHVIDRAPDEGCSAFGEPLTLTTGAGATSFR